MILDFGYIGFIFIAVISGLIFTKESTHFSYKILLRFLFITLLNETVCFYIKNKGLGSTYVFYNIYYYFRFMLLGYLFQQFFEQKIQKIFISVFYVVSLFFLIYNWSKFGFTHSLHSNYMLVGGIFIIIICLLHFYNILKESKRSNPLSAPLFWTATAFLFYFLAVLPFFGIIKWLLKYDMIFVSHHLFLVKSLSILLYSFITIDFIIQWKILKLKI